MAIEIYRPKTFLQIFDAMRRYLIGQSSSLNNFNEGSRLSVLLEAISLIESQTHNDFYQGLKTGIPISVYEGFDFIRLPGIKSTGQLEFTRSSVDTEVHPIPIGTAIILNGIKFETIVYGEIAIGDLTSGQIDSQCSQVGADGNIGVNAIDTSIGQGTFVNQPGGIEAAANPVAFAGGTDEESDEERQARFRIYISALTRSSVNGLISGALSVTGVKSASVVESYPSAGWVTIYVDDGTGFLSPITKAEVEKVINGDPLDRANYPGYRAAGIQIQILAPNVYSFNVTVDIKILLSSLSDDAVLRDIAKTAIEQYINALRLGNDVIVSEISKRIKSAHEDIYDVDITLPISNISIPSDTVPRTNVVTVTSTRVAP